jgi:hypothetical protein
MLLRRKFLEAPHGEYAGVVEQAAQLATVRYGERLHRGTDRLFIADVHRPLPDALVAQPHGGLRQRRLIDIQETHRPTTGMEKTGRDQANAGSGASNQNVLHVRPSLVIP